ncbi:MAG: YwaF family protein [Akkermansiaceae bacterium]
MIIANFQHYGLSHIVALALTVVGAFLMVRFMRSSVEEVVKTRVRYVFGGLLIFAVSMDPVLTFMRWGGEELGWTIFWNSALPLYLCDVVSIVAALALFTKNAKLTEVAYLWGLGGTTQGLLTPTLSYDWTTLEYYNFFLQHGGVPIAAATLVWGVGIVPGKGAFKRIIIWSWVYMAVVIGVNFLINQNYGFLSGKPDFATMFDYMGPYPYYLITLQVIAFSLYYILLKLAPNEKKMTAIVSNRRHR